MRTLKADTKGLALWMEREAKAMDELQVYRELVQNGFEAGASEIILDGWTDPETDHTLARVSDNGSGMTNDQLIDHLSTLHVRTKGNGNYGVGARIAGVARNPAGMTFASRTKSGEGLIKIIKHRGEYVVQEWPVEIDGYEQLLEVVDSRPGRARQRRRDEDRHRCDHARQRQSKHLERSASYKAAKFLAERYFRFPGETKVRVAHPNDAGGVWTKRDQTIRGFPHRAVDRRRRDLVQERRRPRRLHLLVGATEVQRAQRQNRRPEQAQRRRRGGSRERDLRLRHLHLGRLRADLQLGRETSRDPRLDRRCLDGHRQVRDRASRPEDRPVEEAGPALRSTHARRDRRTALGGHRLLSQLRRRTGEAARRRLDEEA